MTTLTPGLLSLVKIPRQQCVGDHSIQHRIAISGSWRAVGQAGDHVLAEALDARRAALR